MKTTKPRLTVYGYCKMYLTLFIALLGIVALSSLFGCNSTKRAERKAQKDIIKAELLDPTHLKFKDSSSTTVQYLTRDSIITVPGESVILHDTISNPCPDGKPFNFSRTFSEKGDTVRVKVTGGIIQVWFTVSQHKDTIKIPEKVINHFEDKSGLNTKVETVTIKSDWDKFTNGFFWVVVAAAILTLGVILLLKRLKG